MTDPRLAASGKEAKAFVCLECGASSESTAANAEFCCTNCRKAWNNRRAMRGAELYDLVMVWRFDRTRSKALSIWTLLCRMASLFRADDVKHRNRRRSWSAAELVIERKKHLQIAPARTAACLSGRAKKPEDGRLTGSRDDLEIPISRASGRGVL